MTIYKKNGKYYCRFQIDGERHHYLCRGAKDEKEARKLESQFMFKVQQQQNGVLNFKNERKTFDFLCKKYENYALLNKKSYASTDKGRLPVIRDFFKNKKYIDMIKPIDIENFKSFLIERKLSKTTINRYLEILSVLFNIAIDNDWISKKPYKSSMKFPIKNYVVRSLKENEFNRLKEASPDYFFEIIMFALQTALRRSNIINLQGKNLNFESRLIEVPENKGNKHIKLYMTDWIYNTFRNKNFEQDEYVFKNPLTNQQWSTAAFERMWQYIRKEANIENFRFHDLRHTVGTQLAAQGVPIPVIKSIMAHTDISTTMRYVHTAPEQMQAAMNLLNSYN